MQALNNNKNKFSILAILLALILSLGQYKSFFSQQGITTIGFQLKPIVPINYFGAGPINLTSSNSEASAAIEISSKLGYCFGMVIRQGLTKTISLETGINYTERNYKLAGSSLFLDSISSTDIADFGFVSYEIPILGLIYIRLADQLYMNAAVGLGINFYASDVASKGENVLIDHYSERARWINLSFHSNLGLEFRTKDKGYFYLGASLNTPFNEITATYLRYYYDDNNSISFDPSFLNGNYVTIDLRYFLAPNKKDKKD